MFTNSNKRPDATNTQPDPWSALAANGAAPAEPREEPARPRLATFEILGQTLVATVTVESLSGPDARRLTEDLVAYATNKNGDRKSTTEPQHLVFDLQNVEYMDSACIGALVELLTSIQKRNGRIALVNAGRNVQYLFRLTQLDRLFPICRDVMQAMQAVERESAVAAQPKRGFW